MKAFRILTTISSLGIILIFSGCGGGGGLTESTQDKQLGLLSQTWKVTSVMLDGQDQLSKWTGFQLTISGTKGATTFNYTCTSRPALSPWPASGTWTFGADPVTQIIRTEDNLPMTYVVTPTITSPPTPATLQLTFPYPTTATSYPGRVSNVSGSWVFKFQHLNSFL